MELNKNLFEIVREDDFVEYFVFLKNESDDSCAKELLTNLSSSVQQVFDKYGSSYIWQKDEIQLIPRFDAGLPSVDDSGL